MKRTLVSRDRLIELLAYDSESGLFFWRTTRNNKAMQGQVAGGLNKGSGYIKIAIDYRIYSSHRLAWLYMHGSWPDSQIDHINEVKTDNRIANLRIATKAQNMRNTSIRADNTSGIKGVSFTKRTKKWAAYIHADGRRIHLGSYTDKLGAANAVHAAREKLHGEFCNHGAPNE